LDEPPTELQRVLKSTKSRFQNASIEEKLNTLIFHRKWHHLFLHPCPRGTATGVVRTFWFDFSRRKLQPTRWGRLKVLYLYDTKDQNWSEQFRWKLCRIQCV